MSDVCVGVEHVALGGILCDVLAIDNNNGGVCDACIYFECYGYHRDLHVLTHSFPTRRSSDRGLARGPSAGHARWRPPAECRSEEHTSELQSLMRISYAVFCLKKQNRSNNGARNELNNINSHRHLTTNILHVSIDYTSITHANMPSHTMM